MACFKAMFRGTAMPCVAGCTRFGSGIADHTAQPLNQDRREDWHDPQAPVPSAETRQPKVSDLSNIVYSVSCATARPLQLSVSSFRASVLARDRLSCRHFRKIVHRERIYAPERAPPEQLLPHSALRVISFINQNAFISSRHHVYGKEKREISILEGGPRFEHKSYQIKLGTIEQTEVENEYLLRPYMNSSKKRKAL